MADTKLTALTAITSADNSDLLYIVDVTGNTPQKITVANLLATVGAQSKILLETITNVTAGDFDFGPGQAGAIIDQGYKRLVIEGTVRGDATVTKEGVHWIVNADTTQANYNKQQVAGENGVSNDGEANTSQIGNCPADSSPANSYGYFKIIIEDYTGPNLKSAFINNNSLLDTGGLQWVTAAGNYSSVTAAITRIRIQTDTPGSDLLFGTLRMYGEN